MQGSGLTQPHCPLCHSSDTEDFFQDKRRSYLECMTCSLVFVPESFHLSLEQEKAEYDLHQNNPDDQGYRTFLSKLTIPLQSYLIGNSLGLDFGCGPGPTISVMFKEAGYQVDDYDPLYFPEMDFSGRGNFYDFIISTEVLEHLRQPSETIGLVWGLIKRGGYLAIMTKQALSVQEFAVWHYKNDPTHICFWRRQTFYWLAETLSAQIVFATNEVIIIQKP